MMNGWDMSGWGWAWMTVTMVIGASLVFLLAMLVLRGPRPNEWTRESDNPLEILAQRYAKGEISEEEYRARRDVLQRKTESIR